MISRRKASRFAGALGLVALLLVPVAFAGHSHGSVATSSNCGTCVVVRHAPSAAPAVIAPLAVFLDFLPIVPVRTAEPSTFAFAPRRGRAPPADPLLPFF